MEPTTETTTPETTPKPVITRTQPLTAEPSAYKINPTDDQRLEDAASRAYSALALAIQGVEEALDEHFGDDGLNAKIVKPLMAADRALRRAAWLTVLYHSTK